MSISSKVPRSRVHLKNAAAADERGQYVLYWMTSQRRLRHNFALDRAIEWSKELRKPLVIFEPLRCDYPWANDRIHRFFIQGMRDHMTRSRGKRVSYLPYIEHRPKESKRVFSALVRSAAVVVGDDSPAFFFPKMLRAVADRIPVLLEVVDSNGLLPLSVAGRAFPTAYAFRRFYQKVLLEHLQFPKTDPLDDLDLPVLSGWPTAEVKAWMLSTEDAEDPAKRLASLPIDHSVGEGRAIGGTVEAEKALHSFVHQHLLHYGEQRNEPESESTSGLSPYLHAGHLSTHEVFTHVVRSGWSPADQAAPGSRNGWWGLDEGREAFLDQIVTWRELSFNTAHDLPDYDQFSSLPAWAKRTLDDHRDDRRDPVYELEDFESAATHDALWNAAQRQIVLEGRMHNYLRMLWGKKILEWSTSPEVALEIMVHLNNKYGLDGRDPNSYGGIFWVLGRYDRPFGPEREIFGKVRYMSSKNTARKLNVRSYIARYSTKQPGELRLD